MVAAIFLTQFLYKHTAIYNKDFYRTNSGLILVKYWSFRNQEGLCHEIGEGQHFIKCEEKYDNSF